MTESVGRGPLPTGEGSHVNEKSLTRRVAAPSPGGRGLARVHVSSLALVLLLLSLPVFAQDPRAIVEESQKRSVSSSQRYEGTLRVVDAKSKVTEKRWQFDRIGS